MIDENEIISDFHLTIRRVKKVQHIICWGGIKGVAGRLGATESNNQISRVRIKLNASACGSIDRNGKSRQGICEVKINISGQFSRWNSDLVSCKRRRGVS